MKHLFLQYICCKVFYPPTFCHSCHVFLKLNNDTNVLTGEFIFMTAQRLGFNGTIPPYATARGSDIIRGVNYGSGGAGIRDESGRQLVNGNWVLCKV